MPAARLVRLSDVIGCDTSGEFVVPVASVIVNLEFIVTVRQGAVGSLAILGMVNGDRFLISHADLETLWTRRIAN